MSAAAAPGSQHCHPLKDCCLIPLISATGRTRPGMRRHHGAAVPSAVPHDRQVRNISPGNPTRPGWLETALFTAMAVNPHSP